MSQHIGIKCFMSTTISSLCSARASAPLRCHLNSRPTPCLDGSPGRRYSASSNLRIVRGDRSPGPIMAAIHAALRLWTADDPADPPPADPQEAAERLYAREAFRAPPRHGVADPYTLPWFEQVEHQRYSRHGYWVPKVLEF